MEICMKDTLRTLRQKKNVTQETLAGHLGITPQSVGKWERGEGFPDITLLPKIAFYFDVTIDELLGVGQARIEERVAALEAESHRLKNIGDNGACLALWEKAYAEMPNNCRVLFGLMMAINREAVWPCPAEMAERIIGLGERILAEATDTELREQTVQKLCYTYTSIGDRENALKYANMGGSMFSTREDLRCFALEGEDAVLACQNYLRNLILLASLTACSMTDKVSCTPMEKIEACRFANDLFFRLYSDGNLGFDAHQVSYNYSLIALYYAQLQDAENTLTALEDAARYAVTASHTGEVRYTAPMVNRMVHRPENSTKNYTGNACNIRLKRMAWKEFDFVRDTPRFGKVVALLESHAE
ncbi:MAG: helix-turn-helix transcriptional regulator [Clostridia bacterium]|nr:helix-turn-helix transcriptional regulator [Clostridia bacterium]